MIKMIKYQEKIYKIKEKYCISGNTVDVKVSKFSKIQNDQEEIYKIKGNQT